MEMRGAQGRHCPPSQTTAPLLRADPCFPSGLTYTHSSTDRCPLVLISLNHVLDVFFKAQNLQHVPVYPIGAACRLPQHLGHMGKKRGKGKRAHLMTGCGPMMRTHSPHSPQADHLAKFGKTSKEQNLWYMENTYTHTKDAFPK